MTKWIILILLIFYVTVSARDTKTALPLAADSALIERDPYLTKFWFDGWLRPSLKGNTQKVHPLWLTYVEESNTGEQRVTAVNFGFFGSDSVKISDKYYISENLHDTKLADPLIENFMGKPVAIWERTDSVKTDLFYSFFSGGVWTEVQPIVDDSCNKKSALFLTHDDGRPENHLFYLEDMNICSALLNENYVWENFEKIYKGQLPVNRLSASIDYNENVWLVFEELHGNDSLFIKTLILNKDSIHWKGPYTLIDLQAKAAQSNICQYQKSYNGSLLLSWVETDIPHDTLVSYSSDSIEFFYHDSPYYDFDPGEVKMVSNNLLYGGCVIQPSVYYFLKWTNDTLSYLNLSQSYISLYSSFYQTTAMVGKMAISGLNSQYAICAWSEWDNEQSDIYILPFFIPIGQISNTEHFPKDLRLFQNYPNPFNPTTVIRYSVPVNSDVNLSIYNLLGQKVATLVSEKQPAGIYEVEWNAGGFANGIYFYRLYTGEDILMGKMHLIK